MIEYPNQSVVTMLDNILLKIATQWYTHMHLQLILGYMQSII